MFSYLIIVAMLTISIMDENFFTSGTQYLLTERENCTEKRLELIEIRIANMMPIGGGRLPENYREARAFCKESVKLVRETENFFRNCYAKEMTELAKIIIYSIKNNIKLYCRKRTKKLTALLSVAPCVNKNNDRAEKCINGFVNQTKQLISHGNDREKIQYACCNYVQGMRCAETQIDDVVCSSENNKELILDTIRGVTGNFVNFACGDFDEASDRCDQLGPQPVPSIPNTKHYHTPIFLLVDLMESMKSFKSL